MSEKVCGVCGTDVVVRPDGAAFHAGELPPGAEYHKPEPVDRADRPEREEKPMPGERLADAMERCADALEKIVAKLHA